MSYRTRQTRAAAGRAGRRGIVGAVGLGLVLAGLLVITTLVLAACGSSSAAGKIAADFSGKTIDGVDVSLGAYRGKPLVLAFMGSW